MITNTTAQPPIVHLVEEMLGKGSIERSEARGAEQLLHSSLLPVDTRRDGDAPFLALGFTFDAPVADDPIFRPATLPAGWSRKAGGSSYWTDIVDERGFKRVAVFYKAAFYDRSAHMSVSCVGDQFAAAAIWGDGPIPWAQLTPDEAAKARASLTEFAAQEPHSYRDEYIAKAKAALKAAP